jgi:hypothetical protein
MFIVSKVNSKSKQATGLNPQQLEKFFCTLLYSALNIWGYLAPNGVIIGK